MATQNPTRKSRRGSGAITLADVAKLAGVAPITASRALNQPGQVSPDVLQRVRDAVARTGYVPNRVAGGLASARSRMMGAIVPSAAGSVFMDMVESLNNTLFDAGYQLMLGQSGYSRQRQDMLIESFISRRLDGILLTGVLSAGLGRTRLLASGIPVVETWDLTPSPMDMLIGFSHEAVGRAVAHFLWGKGHAHFAIVGAVDERATRRHTAFRQALRDTGVPDHAICSVDVGAARTLVAGRQALGDILKTHPKTQAVFCSSDLLALGVLTEAQQRGLRVPDDLAILGFGDAPYVAGMVPGLTTVRVHGEQMGALAARYLVRRAEGAGVESSAVDVGFSIVERETA